VGIGGNIFFRADLEGRHDMFRYAFSAVAAAVITFGTVSALNAETPKVSVAKNGNYCVTQEPLTGSHIGASECHSVSDWAQMGVTFARAPGRP
jgi:hypothetical protein